jgi:hypothetical protein
MGKLLDRETATFNFQMVYDEYKDFMNMTQASGHSFGMKLYKRAVALKVSRDTLCFAPWVCTFKTNTLLQFRLSNTCNPLNWSVQSNLWQNAQRNIE